MPRVNFIFDEFYDNKPYWNMCDIPYHKRIDDNLKPCSFGWWYVDIEEVLSINNTDIENSITLKFMKTTDVNWEDSESFNIYPIFMSDRNSHVPKVLEWIPRVIHEKANAGRLKIIVMNYFEPDYSNRDDLYYTVRNICLQINLEMSSVQIWTNNFFNETNFKPFTRPRLEDLTHFTLHSWESYNLLRLKRNPVDVEQTFSNIDKEKIFLFQNGSPRTWRFISYKMLEYTKAVELGLISYLPETAHRPNEYALNVDHANRHLYGKFFNDGDLIVDSLTNLSTELIDFIRQNPEIKSKTLPNCQMNTENIMDSAAIVNQKWLNETYFSLINESQFTNHAGIISEKTFKMIYYGHPFIIIGSAGTLKELHRIGYETFPELFDESYDEMPASVDKIKFITDQVVYWCKPENRAELKRKFTSIKWKIEHNRTIFLKRNHYKKWLIN